MEKGPAVERDGDGGDGGATGGEGVASDAAAAVVGEPAMVWPVPGARVDGVREGEALVHARAGRTAAAVKLLMVAYGQPLMLFALRVVRDRELAEDVRQQAFLEAYRGLGGFEGRSSLWSWLCGITYHRCLDELRRRRRIDRHVIDGGDVWEALAGTSDPAMDAERLTQRRALERCLGELSDPMRMQLLLRCSLGLSYVEIGAMVGDPHGTVQVRISRILPRLRRCLRGEGIHR